MARAVEIPVVVKKGSLARSIEGETRTAMRSLGSSSAAVAPLGRMLGKIRADADEFTKSIEASNARVIAFGASVAVINGISRAFRELVRVTVQVEKTMADVNAVLQTSQANLQKFGDGIFRVAKNTAQGFDAVSEAALEFSRQGLSMEETLKRTQDALILTRLTGLKAADSVKGLTAAVNGFGKAGLTTTQIINKLSAVDVKFAVGTEDLINALSRAGAVAQDAGVSFDELVGMVTAAQQATARGGAVIGNSFKTIFTRIQRPRTLQTLRELNIAVEDTSGNALSARRVLENLAKSYDGLSQSAKSAVSEQVAGAFQINVLKASLGDLNKQNSIATRATQVSSNATDEAIRKNEKLNQTIAALASQTGTALTELAKAIGDIALAPGMRNLVESVKEIVEGITRTLKGETIGGQFAQGLMRGIGNVLTGPGLVVIGGVFIKLFKDLSVFGVNSLKNLLGLNNAAKQQAALQQGIGQLLAKNVEFEAAMVAAAGNVNKQAAITQRFLAAEVALRERAAKASAAVGAAAFAGGFRVSAAGTLGRKKGFGGVPGFAPTVKSGAVPNFMLLGNFAKMMLRTNKKGAMGMINNAEGAAREAIIERSLGMRGGISRGIGFDDISTRGKGRIMAGADTHLGDVKPGLVHPGGGSDIVKSAWRKDPKTGKKYKVYQPGQATRALSQHHTVYTGYEAFSKGQLKAATSAEGLSYGQRYFEGSSQMSQMLAGRNPFRDTHAQKATAIEGAIGRMRKPIAEGGVAGRGYLTARAANFSDSNLRKEFYTEIARKAGIRPPLPRFTRKGNDFDMDAKSSWNILNYLQPGASSTSIGKIPIQKAMQKAAEAERRAAELRSFPSMAPNFSPLADAVAREKNQVGMLMGISPSSVKTKVVQNSSLKSSFNPQGFGVISPTVGQNTFADAARMHRGQDLRTVNLPNFNPLVDEAIASIYSGGRKRGSAGLSMGSLLADPTAPYSSGLHKPVPVYVKGMDSAPAAKIAAAASGVGGAGVATGGLGAVRANLRAGGARGMATGLGGSLLGPALTMSMIAPMTAGMFPGASPEERIMMTEQERIEAGGLAGSLNAAMLAGTGGYYAAKGIRGARGALTAAAATRRAGTFSRRALSGIARKAPKRFGSGKVGLITAAAATVGGVLNYGGDPDLTAQEEQMKLAAQSQKVADDQNAMATIVSIYSQMVRMPESKRREAWQDVNALAQTLNDSDLKSKVMSILNTQDTGSTKKLEDLQKKYSRTGGLTSAQLDVTASLRTMLDDPEKFYTTTPALSTNPKDLELTGISWGIPGINRTKGEDLPMSRLELTGAGKQLKGGFEKLDTLLARSGKPGVAAGIAQSLKGFEKGRGVVERGDIEKVLMTQGFGGQVFDLATQFSPILLRGGGDIGPQINEQTKKVYELGQLFKSGLNVDDNEAIQMALDFWSSVGAADTRENLLAPSVPSWGVPRLLAREMSAGAAGAGRVTGPLPKNITTPANTYQQQQLRLRKFQRRVARAPIGALNLRREFETGRASRGFPAIFPKRYSIDDETGEIVGNLPDVVIPGMGQLRQENDFTRQARFMSPVEAARRGNVLARQRARFDIDEKMKSASMAARGGLASELFQYTGLLYEGHAGTARGKLTGLIEEGKIEELARAMEELRNKSGLAEAEFVKLGLSAEEFSVVQQALMESGRGFIDNVIDQSDALQQLKVSLDLEEEYEELRRSNEEFNASMANTDQFVTHFENSFANMFSSITTGSSSAKSAFMSFAKSIFLEINKINSQGIARMFTGMVFPEGGASQKAVKSILPGGKQKGGIMKAQNGMYISSGAPSGDSVPAVLEKGEYVLNRQMVAGIGKENLDAMNFGMFPRFGKAKGGFMEGIGNVLGLPFRLLAKLFSGIFGGGGGKTSTISGANITAAGTSIQSGRVRNLNQQSQLLAEMKLKEAAVQKNLNKFGTSTGRVFTGAELSDRFHNIVSVGRKSGGKAAMAHYDQILSIYGPGALSNLRGGNDQPINRSSFKQILQKHYGVSGFQVGGEAGPFAGASAKMKRKALDSGFSPDIFARGYSSRVMDDPEMRKATKFFEDEAAKAADKRYRKQAEKDAFVKSIAGAVIGMGVSAGISGVGNILRGDTFGGSKMAALKKAYPGYTESEYKELLSFGIDARQGGQTFGEGISNWWGRNMSKDAWSGAWQETKGILKGRQSGGAIDSIPTMLTAGEYVVGRNAVSKYGTGFLNSVNRMQFGGSVGNGAFVQGEGSANASAAPTTNNNNVSIAVNFGKGGEPQVDAVQESASQQPQKFAGRIREAVMQVINEEKRVGGSLRNTGRRGRG